jgi:hypothetical protein
MPSGTSWSDESHEPSRKTPAEARRTLNPTFLYVAAVYAAAVWAGRRAGADLPWRLAAFFYALCLLFLFRPLTQDFIDVPVDYVYLLPPWSRVWPHYHAVNREMNDVALQIVPWAHQVRAAWHSLQVPLWNSAAGCGYPLLGNGQSSALSPLRLIALPLHLGPSMTAEAALKLLAALTFTFLFCRRRGYAELPSAIGAVSFAFSTFMTVWLHFPMVTVAAFLPAVFYGLELLIERPSYKRFLFFVAMWVVLFLGGHPETVSHAALATGLYLIFVLVADRRRDALPLLGRYVAALFVAVLISLPLLLPFAEGLRKSRRYQSLEVQKNQISTADLRTTELLLQPHFLGNVPEDIPWGSAPAEYTSGFAGVFGIAAWIALAARLIVRRRWRERETFFVLATPLALGVLLGWPLISDAFHHLPLFSLAANGRLRLLLCWSLAIQAAALTNRLDRSSVRPLLIGVGVTTAALAALLWGTAYPNAWAHDVAYATAFPSVAVLTVATAGAFRRTRQAALLVLCAAVVIELTNIGSQTNPVIETKSMYPLTPLLRELFVVTRPEGKKPPPRVVGIGAWFFPNVASMYTVEDIRTHDPMANGRYMGLLRVLAGYKTGTYFAQWENSDTTLLDYLNVRYVVTAYGEIYDSNRYRLIFSSAEGKIYENRTVLPRFFAVKNVILEFRKDVYTHLLRTQTDWAHTAILADLKPDSRQEHLDLLAPRPGDPRAARVTIGDAAGSEYRMTVEAPRWSLIVSSLPSWPGWKVETDRGKSLRPTEVNGVFLGFVAPPGTTRIRVFYDPASFKTGVTISLLTILGLVAGALFGRRTANPTLDPSATLEVGQEPLPAHLT